MSHKSFWLIVVVVFAMGCGAFEDIGPNKPARICSSNACDPRCDPEVKERFCVAYPDDVNCKKCPLGATGSGDSGASDGPFFGADGCVASAWYSDDDGDGDGDPADRKIECTQPTGYVDNADDLDPGCGRQEPSAGCTLSSVRCTGGTVSNRETCTEDAMFPGCTDWKTSATCGASAPVCGGAGVCGKCSKDADCAGFGQICSAASGACVQCTPATEVAQCKDPNPNDALKAPACDPRANTCTGAPRESVSGCGACKSDSECTEGTQCVQTDFNGSPHGNFCLLVAPQSPSVCPNQYAAKRRASSVLGASADYCFPNDIFTTCEAVVGFKDTCTVDTECGVDGLQDGLCKDNACTYGCDGARDCSGSTSMVNKCVGAPGGKYCDPN